MSTAAVKKFEKELDNDFKKVKQSCARLVEKHVRSMGKVLDKIRPAPGATKGANLEQKFTKGKFRASHIARTRSGISINPKKIRLKKPESVTISNPVPYAEHIFEKGWYHKKQPDVWPGANHPPYKTYNFANDYFNTEELQKLRRWFNGLKI